MRTEVLVIGSGIAGSSAAIRGAELDAEVTVVTKAEEPEETNTRYAQGGIAKVAPGESSENFVTDVIQAGANSDPESVELLVKEGSEAVEEFLIQDVGAEFDADDGEYQLAREGGHSERRILHRGDATGKAIQKALLQRLSDCSAKVLESKIATELITEEGEVAGAVVVDREDGTAEVVEADSTVLATGGIGDVYGHSSNPGGATGDGVAMAGMVGARMDDMEYVQFHPTVHAEREFLISEALRGEGAVLVTQDGERFMSDVHDDAELAPRDVVSVAIEEERECGNTVYLDISPVQQDHDFDEEFPTAYENLTEQELESGLVPVKPAEHFLCGGIEVDEYGRTSVPRLYAAGETACTGAHGANRLASTSLLEGMTWGLRAAEHAVENGEELELELEVNVETFNGDMPKGFCETKFRKLNEVMWKNVGVKRSERGLREARTKLQRLRGEVKSYARGRLDPDLYELRNAVIVGLMITEAALANEKSLGCHQRVTS
ncbi:MAG: L-aspartate oxidase [Halobacteria archaeon]